MAPPQRLVSVVIATYNTGDYLPLAVRSALDQTYPMVDIHVVDDGSTDGTRQAMEQFRDHPSVKYYYQSNQGQAKARNKGIRESQGEYIAFLDADDVWMPRKLEKQLPLLESSERIGVAYSLRTFIDESGNVLPTPTVECHRGKITARLLVDNCVGFSTSVVRRECLDKLGGFDESLAVSDDHELWLRVSTKYDFEFLEESTSWYRVWPHQISTNYMKRFEYRSKIIERFLRQHPNVIDEATISEAWARAYLGRGYGSARIEGRRFEALMDFICALRFRPTCPVTWKEILKLPIRKFYRGAPMGALLNDGLSYFGWSGRSPTERR